MSVRPAVAARGPSLSRFVRLLAAAALLVTLLACSGAPPSAPIDPIRALREAAEQSNDGEIVGRWLLGELLVPGGEAARANRARQKLDALRPKVTGMFASLARAVDDEAHGRFQGARWQSGRAQLPCRQRAQRAGREQRAGRGGV